MVCVDPHDIPVVAFIDPEMMSSMPKGLTAATGMDALTHAIEGYITAGAWELSDMFHLKAIEIISRSLRGAVDNTPEGREGMALGQYIAGMGFSNVGLGIVHSMAHKTGAAFKMDILYMVQLMQCIFLKLLNLTARMKQQRSAMVK